MFLVIPDLIWIQPNVSVEKMLCRNFPGFMAFPALFLYNNTFIIVLLQALQLDTQVKTAYSTRNLASSCRSCGA